MDDFERNLNLKIDCNSLSVAIDENFDVHLFGLQNWIVLIFFNEKKTTNVISIAFAIR